MDEPPPGRCGYTYPSDYETGSDPGHENSCYRESLPDTDRCAWHAHPDETDHKTIENLRAARTPTDIRDQNHPVGELLDGAVLVAIELEDALSFMNTFLREADLWDADLTGAGLQDADLTDANLSGADLTDASLREADLINVGIAGADLTGAFLYRADLTDADLRSTDLTDANLRSTDLTDASLGEADLIDADLSGANLADANLAEADLAGTVFLKATLQETVLPSGNVLSEADLTEAELQDQDLRDENLSDATLEKADLTGVDLSRADLSGANLERALLNRADLFDTRFAGARLGGTVFGDAQINEGTFERLAPAPDETDRGRTLGERFERLVLGPIGHDAYRCVYDPTSRFDPPESDDEKANRDAGANTTEDDSLRAEHESAEREDDSREADVPEVRAGGVYRQFERLARDNALPDWQRRFFILRQDMQTRQKSGLGRAFALVQRGLFGYGESFGRVVGWSVALITAFAGIYLAGGWIRPIEAGGGSAGQCRGHNFPVT